MRTRRTSEMDLGTVLALTGLAAVAGYSVLTPTMLAPTGQDNDLRADEEQHYRELMEAGISWGTQRADLFHMIDRNEAYKPRTAPRQQSTHSLPAVFRDQAQIVAYLKQYGPQFFFMRNGALPLATPQQSNPNVEILSPTVSLRGDPGFSLQYYPRAYVDNYSDRPTNSQFSDDFDTQDAGMPETLDVLKVPRTGQLNFRWNPQGPGGAVQDLNAQRNEQYVRTRGVRLAEVVRPPMRTRFEGSKYPR